MSEGVAVPFAGLALGKELAPIFQEIATEVVVSKADPLIAMNVVNKAINKSLPYQARNREWYGPTMLRMVLGGDCKDYVILKMAALHRAGVDMASMSVVVVKLADGQFHAVLNVEAGGKRWILDNRTPSVREVAQVEEYAPVFSTSTTGSYLYGKKVKADSRSHSKAKVVKVGRKSQ